MNNRSRDMQALIERYEAILHSANVGIYGLDWQGRVTFANAAAGELTGWTVSEQEGRLQHRLIHHSHPDGSAYPDSACPIQATLADGRTRDGEELFWRRDGSALPVSYTCAPIAGERGGVRGAVVTFTDRTAEHLERRYRALVSATSDFVWLCAPDGALVEIDEQWLALTGFTREDALGWGWMEAMHPEDRPAYRRGRMRALARGRTFEREYRLRCADGHLRWFVNQMVPVTDGRGRLVEWVSAGREITRYKRRESDLVSRASRDYLTGLPNRRHFDQALEQRVRYAARHGESLGLVLFDVDRFKAVNDAHGHEAGDAVLKALARHAASRIRSGDLLARWGGEEFVILLPGCALEDACRVAEQVRSRVAAENFPGPGRVTVSAGVAEYQPPETAHSLLTRADEALYRAKSAGRNRVFPGGRVA